MFFVSVQGVYEGVMPGKHRRNGDTATASSTETRTRRTKTSTSRDNNINQGSKGQPGHAVPRGWQPSLDPGSPPTPDTHFASSSNIPGSSNNTRGRGAVRRDTRISTARESADTAERAAHVNRNGGDGGVDGVGSGSVRRAGAEEVGEKGGWKGYEEGKNAVPWGKSMSYGDAGRGSRGWSEERGHFRVRGEGEDSDEASSDEEGDDLVLRR